MIFEAAIGDAVAVPFEYNDRPKFPNDLSAYHLHPRHNIGGGRYSDDTEMSTAVAEAILAGPLTRESLADWFVKAFQREKRQGYASRFYDFMLTVKDGEDFLKRIKPDSDKSGAAMRGWVIGIYPDIHDVIGLSLLQAMITHDTRGGIYSATTAALMTHYFLYNLGEREGLVTFIHSRIEGPWEKSWHGPVGSKGMESVHAAIQAIMLHDNLADILIQCIDYGGDTDTVATIAMGAASCSSRIKNNLPEHLRDGLEDGAWGKNYLRDLDTRLDVWRTNGRNQTP
jgi:ADP-ribosyl-[dinitrogen reductase] hydrolase